MSRAFQSQIERMAIWGQGLKRGRVAELMVGAIAALGFAPFYIAPLTLIAIAWLGLRLYHTHHQDGHFKAGFKTGWVFGFGLFLAGLFWIGSAFTMRPGGYIYLMVPMVGGLIAGLSIFWGIAAGIAVRGRKLQRWAFALKLAALIFLAEFARGHVLGGLPWNLLGYIIEAGHPLSQISSVIGIYGQSFLVLLFAAALMIALSAQTSRETWISGGLAVTVFIGLWSFGSLRMPKTETEYYDAATLRLVMVDFNQRDQFDPNKNIEIVREFLQRSLSPGFEDVTHVIWPEGAVGGLVMENEPLMRAVGQSFLNADPESPPSWVFNSLRHEQRRMADGTARDLYYNTTAQVDFDRAANPRLLGFNDKTRLVPFGEFIPYAQTLEKIGLGTLSAALSSMTPGEVKETFTISGLPEVNSLICYEGIFPRVSRKIKGAPQWILNLSNDGWYGRLTGPYQHANQTRYRAIETGLPLVRASAGGENGLYDAYGRILHSTPFRAARVLDIKIPTHTAKTAKIFQNEGFVVLISVLLLLITVTNRGTPRQLV